MNALGQDCLVCSVLFLVLSVERLSFSNVVVVAAAAAVVVVEAMSAIDCGVTVRGILNSGHFSPAQSLG